MIKNPEISYALAFATTLANFVGSALIALTQQRTQSTLYSAQMLGYALHFARPPDVKRSCACFNLKGI